VPDPFGRGILRLVEAPLKISAALLWDVPADGVDGTRHREFLIGRALGHGSIDAIRALRRDLGDAALRDYLERTRGRRVDRRRLRYLEAILDLDHVAVDAWLAEPSRRIWEGR
jgi:hypothetical protein